MQNATKSTGMLGFTTVWFGQLISLLGTGLTQFALTIWAWKLTGSATTLAIVGVFAFAPQVLVSPFAGALVDRWNRKAVMIGSDVIAGLTTLSILLLHNAGQLQIWHLCAAGVVNGVVLSFQQPAFMAAITMMVPKEHYSRANGMLSLVWSVSDVGAPVLAGILIAFTNIGGVMLIDVITFAFAVCVTLLIHIPQPPTTEEGEAGRGSILKEAAYGFRFISDRPSLLGLLILFMVVNLIGAFYLVLQSPMILARTGLGTGVLGTALSSIGAGAVVGGLVMSAWGGPKRKVRGVLWGMVAASLLAPALAGVGRSLPLWVIAGFSWGLFSTFVNGFSAAIWQAKVAPDVQGRVFGARRLIAQIMFPVALLLAGPLADRLFEPGMQPGGSLSATFSGLVGAGPGAGMALILLLAGLAGATAGVVGFAVPAIRDVETLLPDHDLAAPAIAEAAEV